MQSILKILDDLIITQMNITSSRIIVDEHILKEWLNIAQIEASKIKIHIRDEVFRLSEHKDIKNFISRKHARLIYLSDSLLSYIDQNSNHENAIPENLICVQKAIFLIVDDLLHFVWKNYEQYCNKDQKIPEKYRIFIVREFSSKLEDIVCNEENSSNILLTIALIPIKKVIENKRIKITFRLVYYLRDLLNEINIYTRLNGDDRDEVKLIRRLIHINFNTIHFANYVVSYLRRELNKIDNTTEQIEKLAWYLKITNQISIKPGYSLFDKQQDIKDFLIVWILEEISYLEKKLQLAGVPSTMHQVMEQNFKLATELSVPQFACLIRLLVESGVITNKNKTDIIRFYAMFTKSKRKENITYQSFRSKFYNIDESSKEEIKSLIIQLLKNIQDL